MPLLDPLRITPDSPLIPSVLKLVQREFAYMEARINPQSSMHKLTPLDIEKQCVTGEVWVIGERPDACVFFTEKADCFYLGKLAVAAEQRGKGYARQLIRLAEQRARTKGFSILELETRIELVENHKTFQRFEFKKTSEEAHPGFLEPTYIVMRKTILS
ncbi:GNAT family N-acetyltransferase [Pseudophaeobacter arcticus]|jgi:GNAT superfamily N-acetyltransferase|uniref:GNAT family N-acetyltransferase n=1 Tax=Pseudophaeobacter arcticus TaxID=385492 RepID=UPI0039E524FE